MGKENAPSRWRPRPTFRLTLAEATTTRRAINLRHSVLGAWVTLRVRTPPVKELPSEFHRTLRKLVSRPLPSRGVARRGNDRVGPRKNAPSRWRLRPAFRLTAAEATASRRTINLWRSVLGASRTLGLSPEDVKAISDRHPQIAYFSFRNSQSASHRACYRADREEKRAGHVGPAEK